MSLQSSNGQGRTLASKILCETSQGSSGPILRDLLADAHRLVEPESAHFIEAVIPECQKLYGAGRAFDAIPLAQACARLAKSCSDPRLHWRALTAAGIVYGDTGDYAGSMSCHASAINIGSLSPDPLDVWRSWNNLGAVLAYANVYDLAVECFAKTAENDGSIGTFPRYAAFTNMAQCHLLLGDVDAGIEAAQCAFHAEDPDYVRRDPLASALLRGNYARLLIQAGRLSEAEPYTTDALRLAEESKSPRTSIAAGVTRASLDIAQGLHDVGMTRLEAELAKARKLPAALIDTLVSLVRAEEMANRPARAVIYLQEFADHINRSAIKQLQQHLQIARIFSDDAPVVEGIITAEISRLKGTSTPMPEWDALERMSMRAGVMRNGDARHGERVGAVVRLLAIEADCSVDFAGELGIAASLHDIGILSVPTALVRKTTPLSAAERAILEECPTRGRAMLDTSAHPRALLAGEIAQYHCEHWDGSGFPEKLRGEAIPRAARFCAIARAFVDVIAEGDLASGLECIRTGSGTRFDPALSALFLESAQGGLLAESLTTLVPESVSGIDRLLRSLSKS